MMVNRIWWDMEIYYLDPEDRGQIFWVHDGQVLLPVYIDTLELGERVSDYFHANVGTLEEQLEVLL